jgi:HAD superfamily hydrolase (TIGR01509 family)
LKPYQYFLFDWDGCLAMTLEVWLDAYRTAIKDYGATPSDEEIAHHFGDWELPKYFAIEDFESCNAEAVNIARKELQRVELYPGAKELLVSIKQRGGKLALLSSSSKDILHRGVAHNQITELFDVILSGEDVVHHKPHPEVIVKGLSALGGSKDKAVMIGDSRKDLGAANNAGVDSVLVYPPSHTLFYDLNHLREMSPTYTVESLFKLQEQLT